MPCSIEWILKLLQSWRVYLQINDSLDRWKVVISLLISCYTAFVAKACSLVDEWQAGAWSLALASAIEAEADVAMDVVSAVPDMSIGCASKMPW